jgi:hypothetical protein
MQQGHLDLDKDTFIIPQQVLLAVGEQLGIPKPVLQAVIQGSRIQWAQYCRQRQQHRRSGAPPGDTRES